jgi:hypothetical protein
MTEPVDSAASLESRIAELEAQMKQFILSPELSALSAGNCTNDCTFKCTHGCTRKACSVLELGGEAEAGPVTGDSG